MGLADAPRIVTPRARKIVDQFLGILIDPVDWTEHFSNALKQLVQFRGETTVALNHELESDNSIRRMASAALLLMFTPRHSWGILDPKIRDRAVHVLESFLLSENAEEKENACGMIFVVGTIEADQAKIEALLQDENARVRVYAAAALTVFKKPGDILDIISQLQLGLKEEDERTVAVGALAMARLGIECPDAVEHLKSILSDGQLVAQYFVLVQLKQYPQIAVGLYDLLKSLLADRSRDSIVRGEAAKVIGAINLRRRKRSTELIPYLNTPDFVLVSGVVEGIAASNSMSNRVIKMLASLLSDQDTHLRRVAARGLVLAGQDAVVALDEIRAQAEVETDIAVIEALGGVLAAMGPPAYEPILELLHKGDVQRNGVVITTFIQMQERGARLMAELLDSDVDDHVVGVIIHTFLLMGSSASPGVPALARKLDEATDDGWAEMILIAIGVTGWGAAQAKDSLIRCILSFDSQIADMAARLLSNYCPDAADELERMKPLVDETARRRIDEALVILQHGIWRSRFIEYERLNRDDLWEVFVEIGNIIDQQGPTGWLQLSKQLIQESKLNRKEAAARTIRRRIEELEDLLGKVQLIHRDEGINRGLTSHGRHHLVNAREYLRLKRLELGTPPVAGG